MPATRNIELKSYLDPLLAEVYQFIICLGPGLPPEAEANGVEYAGLTCPVRACDRDGTDIGKIKLSILVAKKVAQVQR